MNAQLRRAPAAMPIDVAQLPSIEARTPAPPRVAGPPSLDAFFIADGLGGQRLCVFHAAQAMGGAPHAAVLYVHPFAEEMNKSRRMAALHARQLAAAGCDVLLIDLHGCGDSSGDFGDAGWQGWIDDVKRGCAWLRQRSSAPLWLWGLRTGALLAVEAARQAALDCHLLLWQPSTSGKAALQQFLRLKAAAGIVGGDAAAPNTRSLLAELDAGRAVEVAGYTLGPALAQGLAAAALLPLDGRRGAARRVEWIDVHVTLDADAQPGAAARSAVAAWQQAGWQVRHRMVQGPSFWGTTEIEDAPSLLAASLDAVVAAAP